MAADCYKFSAEQDFDSGTGSFCQVQRSDNAMGKCKCRHFYNNISVDSYIFHITEEIYQ